MRRYLYSNLLRMIFSSLLVFIFVPSFICVLINENFNITSLVLTISCVVLWTLLITIISLTNRIAKNSIIFEEGKIRYKDRCVYANDISIKYFKFYISVVEPNIVIPKVYINGNNLSVTIYLSKRDVKKLKKMKFKIKEI